MDDTLMKQTLIHIKFYKNDYKKTYMIVRFANSKQTLH